MIKNFDVSHGSIGSCITNYVNLFITDQLSIQNERTNKPKATGG